MILITVLLSFFTVAQATDRPSDADVFGSNTPAQTKNAFESGDVKDNPLTIGGNYYERWFTTFQESGGVSKSPQSLPLTFDTYMDARPNERLRAFVDGRLLYDPTGGNNFLSSSSSSNPAAAAGNSSQVALDSVWLKFDIEHTVFVTAGKQHVKWGTSRFWNPTDFLNTQVRDPFVPVDLRLGNSMVKFAVPWEKMQMNFYGIALFDNPTGANTLGGTGGAFRAEKVIGKGEIGAEVVARAARSPIYGADISAGVGPFDIYAEGACITDPPGAIQLTGAVNPRNHPAFQASGGLNYQFGWSENRIATIGAEYFYNQLGYTDLNVYPVLIAQGQFQPFYLGEHYAGVYITAEGPDSNKATSYTVTTLGNLSDRSFYTRLDFSWRVLTYLTFEAFGGFHYGTANGEFRFGMTTATINFPRPTADLGMGLRMSL